MQYTAIASVIHRGAKSDRGLELAVRPAALGFANEARTPWSLSDLVDWADHALIRTGRMRVRNVFPLLTFRENGVGVVAHGNPSDTDSGVGRLPQQHALELIRVAHQRVMAALSGFIGPNADDRFVQAAIYAGRVSRVVGSDGLRKWSVQLDESVNLSDQVLSLFAADILQHPDDYEDSFLVCEACGSVQFWPRRLSKTGCPNHPQGVISSSSTLPSLRSLSSEAYQKLR